jgi:preprotein translocase subunit SecG
MKKTTLVLVLCFFITHLLVNAQEKEEKEVVKRTYETTFY